MVLSVSCLCQTAVSVSCLCQTAAVYIPPILLPTAVQLIYKAKAGRRGPCKYGKGVQCGSVIYIVCRILNEPDLQCLHEA